MANQEVGT